MPAQVFDYTATVLDKLDKVGAVLIGKLAMVELAGGGGYRFAAASLFGPGLNPWDRTRWSGGSSSGSAAAVAAGLVPFALARRRPDPSSRPRLLRRHRAAAHLRAGEPPRRHGALLDAGQARPVRAARAEDCGLVLQAIAGKRFARTPDRRARASITRRNMRGR